MLMGRRNELRQNLSIQLLKLISMFFFVNLITFSYGQDAFANRSVNDLKDGAYTIDYVILHAETDSASIANDYFEKPATIYVEGDKRYIQFPLNHSEWTKELQAPLGDSFVDVDVISVNEKEDIRVVEFELDRELSSPLEFKMHVLIEEMEPVYDHRYTVRFDFDESSIDLTENAPKREGKMKINEKSSFPVIVMTIIVSVVVIATLILVFINRRKKIKNILEDS